MQDFALLMMNSLQPFSKKRRQMALLWWMFWGLSIYCFIWTHNNWVQKMVFNLMVINLLVNFCKHCPLKLGVYMLMSRLLSQHALCSWQDLGTLVSCIRPFVGISHVFFSFFFTSTYMVKLSLIWSPEVPVDPGYGGYFAPHLTGDAAQFEAFSGHCLCVWVHLHAGSMAQRCYSMDRTKETQLETSRVTT